MSKRVPTMQAFGIPSDVGLTQLPFDEDHGLCVSCEGRPAFIELRRPADTAPRRLCFQCAFEEIAASQPSATAVPGDEEQRLADAEATASPEELGRMAEFLDEWWDAEEEAPPAYVTSFVARHRASAPPLAVPVLGGELAQGDLLAARLALLVMRGALSERHEVADDRYLIEPDGSPVSREKAAELLARMPKPLACHARNDGGIMRIRCRTIVDTDRLHARAERDAVMGDADGYFSNLREAHGDRYPTLPIFCLGCRESLVLAVSDVERWHHDYELHPHASGASPPSAYIAANPEAARAAVAAGAVYLMKCYHDPNEGAAEETGRVIELRDRETWDTPIVYALTTELGTVCEQCGERPATWLATDTRTTPWRDRKLCEVCTAAELAPRAVDDAEQFARGVTQLSEKGRRSMANDIADSLERMGRHWKLLPMPPEVAAALERCRGL